MHSQGMSMVSNQNAATITARSAAPPVASVPAASGEENKASDVAASSSSTAQQTAAEIEQMQAQMATQDVENQEEISGLLSTIKHLSDAVKAFKAQKAPAPYSEVRKAVRAPVSQTPEAAGKAEWDALKARIRAGHPQNRRAYQFAPATKAVAPATATAASSAQSTSKMSFFGLLRQEHAVPSPGEGARGAAGGGGGAVRALGDNDDLSEGFREQEERDAEEERGRRQGVPAAVSGGDGDHSKLSFWAQARNQRGSVKMAAIQRMLARGGGGSGAEAGAEAARVQPAGMGGMGGMGWGAVREGEGGSAMLSEGRVRSCVAPHCTCVPGVDGAVRAAGEGGGAGALSLSQLQGLGPQAHCLYYSAIGPTGHKLRCSRSFFPYLPPFFPYLPPF
jgi:hypothetical protein